VGITIAMVIIYVSRKYILDPKLKQLNTILIENQKKKIPDVIPAIKHDSDVVETHLKIESLEPQVLKKEAEKQKAITERPQVYLSNISDVLSVFEALISRSNLELLNRWRNSEAELLSSDVPMTKLVYKYRLVGTFKEVYRFMENIKLFKYPALMRNVEIRLLDDTGNLKFSQVRGSMIIIEFNLELYCYDK